MKDLNVFVTKAERILTILDINYHKNIEYKINRRATNRLGCCKTIFNSNRCIIEISDVLLNDKVEDEVLMNTLLHEMLHSAYPNDGHKGMWKKESKRITEYTGIKIQRLATKEEGSLLKPKQKKLIHRYKVTCSNCGTTYLYRRCCSAAKNPLNYLCNVCNCRKTLYTEYSKEGWK